MKNNDIKIQSIGRKKIGKGTERADPRLIPSQQPHNL